MLFIRKFTKNGTHNFDFLNFHRINPSIGGKNNAGKPKSVEHKAKIAAANQGWVLSPESKETHRRAMIGNTNSHSQKTPEARAHHSEIMKAAWARRKAKEL